MAESIDVTKLVDEGIPKTWKCPHCGHVQRFGKHAEQTMLEHFRLLDCCDKCSYLHCWELELTDGFKRKVVENLKAIAKEVGLKEEDLW